MHLNHQAEEVCWEAPGACVVSGSGSVIPHTGIAWPHARRVLFAYIKLSIL